MDIREQWLNKIEENTPEMIETLRGLLALPSVVGAPIGDAPFGEGVQKAFEYFLCQGEAMGFQVENIDNYGGHVDFGGYLTDPSGEMIGVSQESIGMVCHLDTVPEGEGWTHPPFAGEIHEGKIYGRGALDNKGPGVACLYAMKALKDVGLVPHKIIRLILGLDEETGWEGMKYYLSKVAPPDCGFAPDAEFPVIHAEKGVMIFDLARKFSKSLAGGLELRSLKGGEAPNMVAPSARAVLLSDKKEIYQDIKERALEFRKNRNLAIHVKAIGKSLEVVVKGVSAHGARPETGVNAISILMDFLGGLPIANDDVGDFIGFYNRHIGYELDGASLGCAMSDSVSGNLILNVGMVELDAKAGRLTLNVRYPVTLTQDQVYEAIGPLTSRYQFGILKGLHHKPLYRSLDDPFLRTLMEVYQEHTGDRSTEPLVIGGGTYARAMENFVAFGASFPGEREVAHQKDEYLDLDHFVVMTKIYADALFRLAC